MQNCSDEDLLTLGSLTCKDVGDKEEMLNEGSSYIYKKKHLFGQIQQKKGNPNSLFVFKVLGAF